MFHPNVTVGRIEGEAEHGGADQDEQNKRGQFGGVVQGLFQQVHLQATFAFGQDQSAQSTHRATFGWSGYAQEDGAQDQEDQDQWWHQHKGDLLGQF